MLITLTLILTKSDTQIDIQVNPKQKIIDTLIILENNHKLSIEMGIECIRIKSKRRKEYINAKLTFEQAELYTGDCLLLI